MKSITVTTHKSYNYGGIIQAYALQKFQESLGIDNSLLSLPSIRKKYRPLNFSSIRKLAMTLYLNINAFVFQKQNARFREKFDQFIEDYLKTTKLFNDKEELYANPPKADFYITGSDQVFALRNTQAYARHLEWAPRNRYSYAASLGEYDWNEIEKKEFARIMGLFNEISVREEYAKNILSSISDKKVRVNLDPVFLLKPEEYDKISSPSTIKEPYILVYPLISNSGLQQLIDESKKLTGYKTVSIRATKTIKYRCDRYVTDAGPEEFINLIRGAKAVITTSFHGTALACLFNIPFYVMIKDFKSQRITDLMDRFGLQDRIYNGDENVNYNVDFTNTNREINIGREEAKEYFELIKGEVLENNV